MNENLVDQLAEAEDFEAAWVVGLRLGRQLMGPIVDRLAEEIEPIRAMDSLSECSQEKLKRIRGLTNLLSAVAELNLKARIA